MLFLCFLKLTGSWVSLMAQWVKNSSANVVDTGYTGLIPGLGRSPRGRNGNQLQYSCLKNPMNREPGGLQSRVSELDTIEQKHKWLCLQISKEIHDAFHCIVATWKHVLFDYLELRQLKTDMTFYKFLQFHNIKRSLGTGYIFSELWNEWLNTCWVG